MIDWFFKKNLNSSISIITLSKNVLNAPIKRQRLTEWHTICVHSAHCKPNLKHKETWSLEVKVWKKCTTQILNGVVLK